jgi:hypothetical protein
MMLTIAFARAIDPDRALQAEAEVMTIHQLLNRNLQDTSVEPLKAPLMRHRMFETEYNAALMLLEDVWKGATFICARNLTDKPYDVWISNELKQFTKQLVSRDGRVIFVGLHPVFDSLSNVFNLYYDDLGGNKFATLSEAGHLFPVPVDPTFRCTLILDDVVPEGTGEYRRLPPPFLKRFEKFSVQWRKDLP